MLHIVQRIIWLNKSTQNAVQSCHNRKIVGFCGTPGKRGQCTAVRGSTWSRRPTRAEITGRAGERVASASSVAAPPQQFGLTAADLHYK